MYKNSKKFITKMVNFSHTVRVHEKCTFYGQKKEGLK